VAERIPGITTDAAPPAQRKILAPGSLVANRYRLEARLGAGGGGTVWRCHDQELSTTVALKIVTSDGDLERWRREVAMARRIADRHVCRVHDLGEAGDVRFVTMELVAGDSLRTKIAPALDPTTARELFTQIVAGVAAIHAAGVVHRDLKPENIVVGDGRAVIVDFGLAREPATATTAPSVTQRGAVVGTPRYMAPEQAIGATADARSDVWALGLVGHELMSGVLPALVESELEVSAAADRRWPGIAPILRRCLALEPDDRFADARALAAALAALSPRRRNRRIAIVAALGAVAIGGLVVAKASSDGAGTAPGSNATPGSNDTMSGASRSVVLEPIGPAPKRWPQDAPASVLLSRDGKRYATTTVAADQLFVRAVDATPDAPEEVRPLPKDLITTRAVGWFSDDSIAVLATTREGTFELHRVDRAGTATLVHRAPQRFVPAIGPRDQIAIGHREGVWLIGAGGPTPLATNPIADSFVALAWSRDGTRLAVARARGADATIQIVNATAVSTPREVWTGESLDPEMLLAWLDDQRLVFTTQPTTLVTIDTAQPTPMAQAKRADLADLVGPGSAAAGTLLVLRTTPTDSVQVGDDDAEDLAPAIANIPSSRIAGWTTDGRLVFAAGTPPRIVRAEPGTSYEPWPGTEAGREIPDTVVGDSVIAHRLDPAAPVDQRTVVERIDADGKKHELVRLHADRAPATPVRCAGDRAAPCLLYALTGSLATWTEIDPETGQRGRLMHTRGGGAPKPRDAVMSPDGTIFAIVEGTAELTAYDRGTVTSHSYRATDDTAFDSLGFSPTGDVWATSRGFRGRRFGLVSFKKSKSKSTYFSPSGKGSAYRDALRRFTRPRVSPDGKRVAVEVRELRVVVARVRF